MGEITESKRRHYVGDDADKDSIPAGGKAFGDSYHANDKGKQYYWNGTAWKTGLGYEYVARDAVSAWDKGIGDVTADGAFHVDGFDFTGIVPAGAVAVHYYMLVNDDAVGNSFIIRRDAGTGGVQRIAVTVNVANQADAVHGIVGINADRLMDYLVSAGVDEIRLAILGWFI